MTKKIAESRLRLFDYDSSDGLKVEIRAAYNADGVPLRSIAFQSPKGGWATGYLALPRGRGPHAGILFGHWNNGTGTEFIPEALALAGRGAACLIVDHPWVRPRDWRVREYNFDHPEKTVALYTQAVVDLRRGLDLLQDLPGVHPGRLGYVGHSLGAQMGAILSAVDKRLQALALVGGVPSNAELFRRSRDPDMVGFRKSSDSKIVDSFFRATGGFDAIEWIPHAGPASLLFQFARFERHFGQREMLRYYRAASRPKQIQWYYAGHELNHPRAAEDRYRFLKRHLGLK